MVAQVIEHDRCCWEDLGLSPVYTFNVLIVLFWLE